MALPQKPPLNGRIIAEFYLSSETVKRTTLRAYARPPDEQKARVLLYDPIRRIVSEYFRRGRAEDVLLRCEGTLDRKHFDDASFEERWLKSNRAAVAHLRGIELPGSFEEVRPLKTSITIGQLDVFSTVDFYARFAPSATNAKRKAVAVIVSPSGIKKPKLEDRKRWAEIESEVGFRAAAANGIILDEVFYIDLPHDEHYRFKSPKARVWSEIDATCERIFRDWRDLRLETTGGYGEEQG